MDFERNPKRVRVAKLILQESGTYNVLYHRPYKTTVTPHDLENITTRIDQTNGQKITGSLLAGVASNILSPSASPEGNINIPNGWNERRIRFVMEVHVDTSMSSNIIYFFQGFTSHLGITPSGHIDPNMEFYINSFIRVSRLTQQTPYGTYLKDIVTESAHVLNGSLQNNMSNLNNPYIMRPQDIFHGIQSNYLNNVYINNNSGSVIDTRITLGNNQGLRSKRDNNLPANYLANIIDSFQNGNMLAEFGQENHDVMSRCASLVVEEPISENIFIRAINNVKGYSLGASFNFGDLEKVDPNINAVTNYITLGQVQINQLHTAGQTAYWNASDRETLVATILSNSVPAIMMDLMISKLHFRTTNDSIGGVVNTIIIDGKSLTDADISGNFQYFKTRLEKEILYDISFGNQDIYLIEMQVDLFGETKISVSLSGGPVIMYAVPSFCDSLTVPVIAGSKDSYFNVVHDFEVIMNNVNTANNNPLNTGINYQI